MARHLDGAGWALQLLVDATGMAAHVKLQKSDPAAVCSADDVLGFLRDSGLAIADPANDQLGALGALAQAIAANDVGDPVLVASGVPARPASRELQWRVPINPPRKLDDGDGGPAIDLHEVTRFVNVRAGEVLCEIVSTPAVLAKDVFGASVVPEENLSRAPEAPLIKLGERVTPRAGDEGVIIASEDGCVRYDKGVLSIQKVLEVRGDVDFKIGNITFNGQVVVSGDVLSGFQIKASGDVVVKGMVENAAIEAGGDIAINGGVAGRHGASHLTAGGSIKARYLHMVKVDCKKDLTVAVECIDCEITCGGDVLVAKGGLIGGTMRAGGRVQAPIIGSEMCVPTAIATSSGHTIVAARRLFPNVTVLVGGSPPYRTTDERQGPITLAADAATGTVHLSDTTGGSTPPP